MKKTFNDLALIPGKLYEGYIWGSDDNSPLILRDEAFDISTWLNNNPYIVEALLYSKEDNFSLHIRHTGNYQIATYDLNGLSKENLQDVSFLPHRLDKNNKGEKINRVCFQQLWLPEDDPYCEGMPVLKMKALIFTGFDNAKNQTND